MSDYKITLAEGVTYTTAWRTSHSDLVKGFKIDKAEVNEIFADENAVAMRAYLGYDGKDILSNVYDFCEPCPSTCDESSVLCIGE